MTEWKDWSDGRTMRWTPSLLIAETMAWRRGDLTRKRWGAVTTHAALLVREGEAERN